MVCGTLLAVCQIPQRESRNGTKNPQKFLYMLILWFAVRCWPFARYYKEKAAIVQKILGNSLHVLLWFAVRCWSLARSLLFSKKIRTHLDLLSIPQLRGKKCQNVYIGWIKGCKYKTSSWHLKGFPDGNNIVLVLKKIRAHLDLLSIPRLWGKNCCCCCCCLHIKNRSDLYPVPFSFLLFKAKRRISVITS